MKKNQIKSCVLNILLILGEMLQNGIILTVIQEKCGKEHGREEESRE